MKSGISSASLNGNVATTGVTNPADFVGERPNIRSSLGSMKSNGPQLPQKPTGNSETKEGRPDLGVGGEEDPRSQGVTSEANQLNRGSSRSSFGTVESLVL